MSINRYNNVEIVNDTVTGKRNYATAIFQSIPPTENDTFIITSDGDRLDLLANRFYGDSSLWWVIAVTNGLSDSFFVPPGTRLRIPGDMQFAQSYMSDINNSR